MEFMQAQNYSYIFKLLIRNFLPVLSENLRYKRQFEVSMGDEQKRRA